MGLTAASSNINGFPVHRGCERHERKGRFRNKSWRPVLVPALGGSDQAALKGHGEGKNRSDGKAGEDEQGL